MIFLRFVSEGLAARSYLIGSGREAVVVDPRRDVGDILEAARARCLKIRYVLETHRHEDFVLGSTAVRAATGAPVCRGENPAVKYADRRLKDGETLRIGGLLIKALETPGHTPDSLSYALYEADWPDVALVVFSGDALFAGSCGRVDLNGEDRKAESAEILYRSLYEKLLPLGDQAILCPAHGAGSVCGRGIGDREEATIGYERSTNPWLAYDRETFVREKVAESPPFPRYFPRMERLNSDGPPALPEAPVPIGTGQLGQALREEGACLVDTRMPTAFAGGHVPGALSIFLDGMTVYPGWLIDDAPPVYLVTERPEDAALAGRYLARIGLDRVAGYLCGGFEAWQNAGLPVGHVGALSVDALKAMLDAKQIRVVDVREPDEWAGGIVPGAEPIFLGDLPDHLPAGPKDAPIASMCSVGRRGSIGASILRRAGFINVYNVLGGTTAWVNRGYPLAKYEPGTMGTGENLLIKKLK